ncbi:MAG: cupredoxin domain-containing protein [Candidatus Paceibacterota bacterium]|nr:MAG: cupredoxin domain-containing protein [Candidatus Paceibacterota bacterium]
MRIPTTLSIVLGTVLVVAAGVGSLVLLKNILEPKEAVSEQNVEIRDGIQYVTIKARGGYSPRQSRAQANIPTRLIVKTNGTYDCSLALVIRSIGYQKILSQTGEEVIDLGNPSPGTLQGLCSMGMYSFAIAFE